jgi:hypothetical protein
MESTAVPGNVGGVTVAFAAMSISISQIYKQEMDNRPVHRPPCVHSTQPNPTIAQGRDHAEHLGFGRWMW